MEAELIGSGIINLNLAPEKTEWNNMRLRMIGVYSRNREEWLTLDYGKIYILNLRNLNYILLNSMFLIV